MIWARGVGLLRGCPLERVTAVTVALVLARGGWRLLLLAWVAGGVWAVFSQLCEVLAIHGGAASTTRCYGGGGARLHGRAASNLGGVEMCGHTDENPVRFLSGLRRWHLWVPFPSLEASSSYVAISLARLVWVGVSGRKPRFGAGSARWRRRRRRPSVGGIVLGDMIWRSMLRSSGDHRHP